MMSYDVAGFVLPVRQLSEFSSMWREWAHSRPYSARLLAHFLNAGATEAETWSHFVTTLCYYERCPAL